MKKILFLTFLIQTLLSCGTDGVIIFGRNNGNVYNLPNSPNTTINIDSPTRVDYTEVEIDQNIELTENILNELDAHKNALDELETKLNEDFEGGGLKSKRKYSSKKSRNF